MTQKLVSIIGSRALRVLRLGGFAAALALAFAPAAEARTRVDPYIEIQQVLSADLNDGGDVLTYTALAAGIDARTSSKRVEAQISYRYERRIPWDNHLEDGDVHSGLAQVRLAVAPEVLSLDAGAIATRSRVDGRGPILGFTSVDSINLADVYGIYAGPTIATHAGPVEINAFYRFGYVKVDDHQDDFTPPPGQPRVDRFDSSTTHNFAASAGMGPGELPFGWTLGAGYIREDTNRLEQRFEDGYVRGDIVLPVSSTFALTAGVGYEKLKASQQDILRDAAGLPVLTPGGNPIPDPAKPRLLAYDQSGLIADAGVIWRPNPNTELQARIGRRYGGTTFTGSLRYKMSAHSALTAQVYDSVDSFGRLVVTDISGLPVNFNTNPDGLNSGIGGIGGCIFGTDPGTGGCLNDVFSSINASNFRNRGVSVLFSSERGLWSFGIGADYNNRKYLAPRAGTTFSIAGVTDESASVQAYINRKLSRTSGINLDTYASWYDSGLPGSDSVFGAGVTGTYYRSFLLERLQAEAAVGLFTTDSGQIDSTVASALVGLRYHF